MQPAQAAGAFSRIRKLKSAALKIGLIDPVLALQEGAAGSSGIADKTWSAAERALRGRDHASGKAGGPERIGRRV